MQARSVVLLSALAFLVALSQAAVTLTVADDFEGDLNNNQPLTNYYNGQPFPGYNPQPDPTSQNLGITLKGAKLGKNALYQPDLTSTGKFYATGDGGSNAFEMYSVRGFTKYSIKYAADAPVNIKYYNKDGGLILSFDAPKTTSNECAGTNSQCATDTGNLDTNNANLGLAPGFDNYIRKVVTSAADAVNVRVWEVTLDGFDTNASPVAPSCKDTADVAKSCGNGACVKVPGSETDFACSCFSGFYGAGCTGTYAGFQSQPVSANNLEFKPVLDLTATDKVKVVVTIPSSRSVGNNPNEPYATSTILKFGGSTTPIACNYPNQDGSWIVSSQAPATGSSVTYWSDVYTRTFTYDQLVACGLTKNTGPSGVSAGYISYNNTLLIQRNLVIGNGRFKVERTVSMNEKFGISFPTALIVKKSVILANDTVESFVTISRMEYAPDTDKWTLELETAIAPPYKFGSFVTAPTFGLNADRALTPVGSQPTNIFKDGVDTCNFNSATMPPTGDCRQKWTWTINGCPSVSFTDISLSFPIKCRSDANYPDVGTQCPSPVPVSPVAALLSLTTTTACPVEEDYIITPVLKTYASSSSYADANQKLLFGYSETVYARITFPAPPVDIDIATGVTVVNVCAYPVGATGNAATCTTDNKLNPNPTFTYSKVSNDIVITFSANAGTLKAKSGLKETDNDVTIEVDFTIAYQNTFVTVGKRSEAVVHRYGGVAKLSVLEPVNAIEEAEKSSATLVSLSLFLIASIVVALL